MRRLSIAALVAVPLLFFTGPGHVTANPPGTANFGCGGACLKLFPHIHQHGPLFNYGPYYGYYPFKPYGPWDEYLRYDPNFYGDAGAGAGNMYGRNPLLPGLGSILGGAGGWFKHGCVSCGGFWHASWLHGGWFRGHTWLTGSHGGHKSGCSSCGGVATAAPVAPTGDATARYAGVGTPTQSAVFYSATPTLDPTLELVPTAGRTP